MSFSNNIIGTIISILKTLKEGWIIAGITIPSVFLLFAPESILNFILRNPYLDEFAIYIGLIALYGSSLFISRTISKLWWILFWERASEMRNRDIYSPYSYTGKARLIESKIIRLIGFIFFIAIVLAILILVC